MSQTQRIEIDGRSARVIDTDDGQTVVLDLGADVNGSVEVLGETVLVVTDGDQHDIDLGVPIERAYLNNGILTIEYGGQV